MPLDKAPFDANGSLLSYVSRWQEEGVEWQANESFSASLQVYDYSRGRSSAIFILRTIDGRTFPMFMSEMLNLLKVAWIDGGVVGGRWDVVKRGTNYGLRYVGPA
jgi:hypothetical protein